MKNLTAGRRENKIIHVIQGDFYVSRSRSVTLTTVLGSCVSTCMSDPEFGIGGMNHFLLPSGSQDGPAGIRYGLLSMELLINGLLKLGARKEKIQAKLFGGAAMNKNLPKIGESNSQFALKFLEDEGICCVSKSLGGVRARKIQFIPSTGEARQKFILDYGDKFDNKPTRKMTKGGDVELF